MVGAAGTVSATEPVPDDFIDAKLVLCNTSEPYVGNIASADQVDYYSIDLVAGQAVTIDVNAQNIGSPLDSLLEVFQVVDGEAILVDASDDSQAAPAVDAAHVGPVLSLDPYLELIVPAGGDVTYYLAVSASSNTAAGDPASTGSYEVVITCSDPAIPPDPPDPVKIGDLLGATGFNPGSILMINPTDATTSVRFPLEIGPIADIEFDPLTHMLLVAVNAVDEKSGSMKIIDPDTGDAINSFELNTGAIIALEGAADKLYGVYVHVDSESPDKELFDLVTIAEEGGKLILSPVSALASPVWSLAYHPSEQALYGSMGGELIKFDLRSEPIEMKTIGQTSFGEFVALDFSPENVLYGVNRSADLLRIDHNTLVTENLGSLTASPEFAAVATGLASAQVSGLTFVVEEAPALEPIKAICSSSFTDPSFAGSELGNRKLQKFRLKRNPLHRAIGLFKFEGKANEIIQLSVYPEEADPGEAEESSMSRWIGKLWPKYKPKNRVFVAVRKARPGMKFRVKTKGELPLDIENLQLPEDGWYYIMVIRPLPRFFSTDYCVSLESTNGATAASLQVAWPGSDSEEDAATATPDEDKAAEPESGDESALTSNTESHSVSVSVSTEEDPVGTEPAADPEQQPENDTTTDTSTAASSDETTAETTVADEPAADSEQQPENDTTTDTSTAASSDETAAETTVADEPAADDVTNDAELADDAAKHGAPAIIE
jgi:hypothetical protein